MTSTRGLALVTGASRGIGRVVAEQLAADGYEVIAVATSLEKLEAVAGTSNIFPVALDVSDANAVDEGWRRIVAEHGVPTLVINNAGIAGDGDPSWEVEPADWWRVFEVNVLGVYLMCRAAVPAMIARGSGRIINVSSGAGFFPISFWNDSGIGSAYMASKAAVIRFTEALASEAAGTGVTVFSTSPGTVKTDMTDSMSGGMWDDPDIWSPPEATADFVKFIDTGALDALSGRFISAVRHDWRNLPDLVDVVLEQDQHALRLT
jgi:NAD(P)-dependent dehydrogenase (short-subunit alcohol dehydrogenase family)